MQGTLAKPLDIMAVIIDKTAPEPKAEVLQVDQVWCVEHQINHLGKIAFFSVAFGGKDSTGKLHIDPIRAQNIARIAIKNDAFEKFFECEGNPIREHSQELLDRVFAHVVASCDQLSWSFDEIAIDVDGVRAFEKKKPEAQ